MHDSSTRSACFEPRQPLSNTDAPSEAVLLLPSTSQVSSNGPGAQYSSSAPPALPSSMLAPRGLRFPSSRRYLWDRTPAGPQVLINTQDHVPHVQVAASAFGAVSRAAEHQTGTVPLQLGISVNPINQVTALVQELDPLVCKAGDYLQLNCPLLKPSQQQLQDAAHSLRAVLQAQLDQRSSARVQELYALSASATPAVASGERVCLQLQLLMPCCSLLATPLYTKRLCHLPLAQALLQPGGMAAWQSGFLSMDQARSLLPLEATDVNVSWPAACAEQHSP
ncbi:hypothetical protein COO60DRAFT_47838 [Scenedesmus sp. NREL 46B-D3]|nr:hypothetical protein COO60DRAFT_47838 [Scenedesmus sp. NREL 46B-D3]